MGFSINDKLLDGGTVKVVPVGQKKGIFTSIVIAATLAAGAGALFVYNQSDNVSTQSPTVINNIKEKIQSTVSEVVKEDTNVIKNPIYGNFVSDPKLKEQIEKMGNFELPEGMKPNQISRHVAKVMFEKGGYAGYTSSLISEREGFKKHLYNDVGWFAIGNGMNLGVNSKTHIKNVLGSVSQDQQFINDLVNLSGKKVDQVVPPNFKNLTFSPQRSIQVAMIMSQTYEKSAINSLSNQSGGKGRATFDKLADNEQGAIVNIPYQKGSLSISEAKSIAKYALDPNKTKQKAMDAIDTLSITYMLDGKRIRDVRAETLLKALFVDKNLYAKIIANDVKPKDVAEFSPIFKGNVKVDNSGTVSIEDPIGVEKEKAEKEGRILKLTIVPDLPEKSKAPKAHFFGI